MNITSKVWLFFLVLLVIFSYPVDASIAGVTYGACKYEAGDYDFFVTPAFPSFDGSTCWGSFAYWNPGSRYYLSAYYAGQCVKGQTEGICYLGPERNGLTDSSANPCAEIIQETPIITGYGVGGANGRNVLHCECDNKIYSVFDPGKCVNNEYLMPAGFERQYIGNAKYWVRTSAGHTGTMDNVHQSGNSWPVARESTDNGDDTTWYALVYVPEDEAVRYRAGAWETNVGPRTVDDDFSVTFYPLATTTKRDPPIEDKKIYFDVGITTYSNYHDGPIGTGFSRAMNLPKGFYLLRVFHETIGNGVRYLYDFRFVNEADGRVDYSRYFTVFEGRDHTTLGNNLRYFDVTDLAEDMAGYVDGDVDKLYCGEELLGKAWSAHATSLPEQRRCCGDDPGDLYYIDQDNELFCGTDQSGTWAWMDLSQLPEGCPGYEGQAHYSLDVITALGNQYNRDASDGSDACCGDDKADMCDANSDYLESIHCYDYQNSQEECETIPACKWDPNFADICIKKDLFTIIQYCNGFEPSECPALICNATDPDFGYVTPDGQYLCYNKRADLLSAPDDEWVWLDAKNGAEAFNVKALDINNHRVDYISNANNWSYCNANNYNSPYGTPIAEYKTFSNEEYFNGQSMNCSTFMNFFQINGQEYQSGCGNGVLPCCTDQTQINPFTDPVSILDCEQNCYDALGNNINICNIPGLEYLCTDPEGGATLGSGYVEKSLCGFDMSACLNLSRINPKADTCADAGGLECNNDEYCTLGMVVILENDKECCIGESASCEDESKSCDEMHGTPYKRTLETCPKYYDNFRIDDTYSCCLGTPVGRTTTLLTSLAGKNNASFICHSRAEDSIFGNCCYGKECANFGLLQPPYLLDETSKNTVYSTGVALQTVNSYDRYIIDKYLITDFSLRIIREQSMGYLLIGHPLPMSDYDYIEFHVAYNNEFIIGDLYINNRNYGPLKNFITDGTKAMRWHHVMVPINLMQKNELFEKLKVTHAPNMQGYRLEILLDNIILRPGSNSPSSDNYYCTGGFTSWIPDLDTDLSKPEMEWESDFYTEWPKYGPYAFACNAQGPFQWTGHQCCGDDSRFNYGEHYADEGNGQEAGAGCFNGTIVFDQQTVAYAKGYDQDFKEFIDYRYNDLIFNDTFFVACQAPESKYEDLFISYDGTLNSYPPTPQGDELLVTNYYDKQCGIIGGYYCMDNTWLENTAGSDELYIKPSPPPIDLIINGDFEGECPPNICGQPIGGGT